MFRFTALLALLVALFAQIASASSHKERKLSSVTPFTYARASMYSDSTCSDTKEVNWIGLRSGSCIPIYESGAFVDYSTFVCNANGKEVDMFRFSANDTKCAGPSTKNVIAINNCGPYTTGSSDEKAIKFTCGTSNPFASFSGLYPVQYNSLQACAANDENHAITASMYLQTLPLPNKYFGQTIKTSCASPSSVKIEQFSNNATTVVQSLGGCTASAQGVYYSALKCFDPDL